MARPSLLVVEDDLQVLQGLVSGLSRAGFDVTVAVDGADAMRLALQPFDAVVLDLMLVGCTGFDVLAAVRGRVSTPVIVLSARTELHSRLKSFELGAVDFVPKPFWMEELVVRLRARLALREAAPARTLDVGAVVLDLDRRSVTRDGADLGLTRFEFNILAWLAERPGRSVSRSDLAEHTLSDDSDVTERTVDTHISRIRKKLGADGALIATVWGIGYRFTPRAPR